MKVIVDNKIPYINKAIENIADEVVYLPGKDFTSESVKDADALIVRTRTHCNRNLLEGSRVKFIATATIGYDHIDADYCRERDIAWTNAPGCNAASVAQYIESALLLLHSMQKININAATIGIVGAGNVGSKVQVVAQKLGIRVLVNDLPRQDKEGNASFTDLHTIASECNIITFHTPLNSAGKYKTLHLANEEFFNSLKKKPIIINTSRGEVIETKALLHALNSGIIADAIIDVWEKEPDINPELLNKAFIATPHIAGYSADGKANATRMALEALCNHFEIKPDFKIVPPLPDTNTIYAANEAEALLKIYNPLVDSDALKAHPELFEQLRGDYPLRREAEAYNIILGPTI
ncbi:4-phosphoerythronate dehydrogenase PdxB [uncultured Bacteroides sp.]|uniref:4-phosphoerythronate dehydrogenase PdxB n=1 Tax=uncultured Bacteroides sp. TaxID=162156 RepID=UPI002AA9346A|nr:4-phosphoerythronate dehydrogenase PdxB [uncultured Bacteroides sp.]